MKLKLILPNLNKNQRDSKKVLKEIIELGIKSLITSVNTKYIGKEWLGKVIDNKFLKFLESRKNIDFCGEKGEYHTCVIDAPFFSSEIKVDKIGYKKESNDDVYSLKMGKFYLSKK